MSIEQILLVDFYIRIVYVSHYNSFWKGDLNLFNILVRIRYFDQTFKIKAFNLY